MPNIIPDTGKNYSPRLSNIFIEISGRCNAQCPYCARQRFEKRYAGDIMPPALFEKILDHLFHLHCLPKEQVPLINLYNWGEPFLHPQINDILEILKARKLYAGISSNFIVKPGVKEENLPVIKEMVFSLSGFSQNSYGRIHGASLKNVLGHFEEIYQKIRNTGSGTGIRIAWHRYKFNESELWKAYQYFSRPGIRFSPSVAYSNDLFELLQYAEGTLEEGRLRQAEKDLFLEQIPPLLTRHQKNARDYHCFMWDYLVIDEKGQLLLCCGLTNHDTDHVLGNVLEMSAEEIWRKKLSDSMCSRCIASGLPASFDLMGEKPLPPGGGRNYLRLWQQLYLSNYIYPKATKVIRHLPGGGKTVPFLKKIKTKIGI